MLKNRFVPADTILPHLVYDDAAALAWLERVFGFAQHFRYGERGGPVQGAQMHLGDAWIMLASSRPDRASPSRLGYRTQSLSVFVEDIDAPTRGLDPQAPRLWKKSTRPSTGSGSMGWRIMKVTTGCFQSMFAT